MFPNPHLEQETALTSHVLPSVTAPVAQYLMDGFLAKEPLACKQLKGKNCAWSFYRPSIQFSAWHTGIPPVFKNYMMKIAIQ